jgi:hypothetical protein
MQFLLKKQAKNPVGKQILQAGIGFPLRQKSVLLSIK